MKIRNLKAREILDSRGIPTIESILELEDGSLARGAVPSGTSSGQTEVLELRDGDTNRYFGKGTLKAVDKVNNEIAPMIIGKEFSSQEQLDNFMMELDGTPQKSKLGGNSILSVSMAFCRATAMSRRQELFEYFAEMYWGNGYNRQQLQMPTPQILIMEGGAHGNWSTDFQEYMIMPKKEHFPDYKEALRAGAEVFKATHDLLVKKGYSATVGMEGAFSPIQIESNVEAFEILMEGIKIAGYEPGEEIVFAVDIASSEFYSDEDQRYNLKREGLSLTSEEWLNTLTEWMKRFPLWSIEDPMDQEDWTGWQSAVESLSDAHQIVGDDLLTTNVERIKKGIQLNAVNSVLIKLNQIGTVTETLNAIKMARAAGYTAVVSHRSGETNDDMIADLVVGTEADQSKFGGPDRGERLAKYNRLLEIEDLLLKV